MPQMTQKQQPFSLQTNTQSLPKLPTLPGTIARTTTNVAESTTNNKKGTFCCIMICKQ